MIEIITEFEGETANSPAGNLNAFLRSLVVEVVSENYRQALSEDLLLRQNNSVQPRDIALQANEQVVKGLFAFALGKLCSFARPEIKTSNDNSYGHVDFLAWYNSRVIAIELKAGRIALWNQKARADEIKKWAKANSQAKSVQNHLRSVAASDDRMQKPISIALMIVAGRSNAMPKDKETSKNEEPWSDFKKALHSFKPKPEFSAIYSAPAELTMPVRLKGGAHAKGGEQTYIPCYGFLASSKVKKT